MGEKRGEIGGIWDYGLGENGTTNPFFTVPFLSLFWRSKTFRTVPFEKMKSRHPLTEKWQIILPLARHLEEKQQFRDFRGP